MYTHQVVPAAPSAPRLLRRQQGMGTYGIYNCASICFRPLQSLRPPWEIRLVAGKGIGIDNIEDVYIKQAGNNHPQPPPYLCKSPVFRGYKVWTDIMQDARQREGLDAGTGVFPRAPPHGGFLGSVQIPPAIPASPKACMMLPMQGLWRLNPSV